MRKTRSNELKAGIFLLAATVLLAALVLKISGTLDLLTRETYQVRAHFSNTLGIAPMSKVTLNGVKVGRVTDIQLVEAPEGTLVELTLELDKARARLHEDARAMITAETFLSEKHIDLRPGSPQRPLLGEDEVIAGLPATDINDTLAKVDESVAAVRDLVTDEKIGDNIRSIFEDARSMLADLRKVSMDLDDIVVENRAKVTSVLDNVDASSQNIYKISERIDESIRQIQSELLQLIRSADSLVNENRPDVRALVEQARGSMETLAGRIDRILQDLNQMSEQLTGVLGENRDELDRIVRNLDRTSANVRRFSQQVADYPWQLLYPTAKRRESQTLFPAWMPVSATESVETE